MDIETLKSMTYTQFVAYIDQWNVPPGALDTINQWSVFGHVTDRSNILEIACTTGLSSREIARITCCSSVGIDLCADSIEAAKMNAQIYGEGLNLHYECADACKFQSEKKFTHLIIGASLGFFSEPNAMINRLPDFFDHEGYILASPYYRCGDMPEQLKQDCHRIIGIIPTTTNYDEVRNVYANFEVAYEKRCNIVLETEEQMKKYTYDSITRACKLRNISSPELFEYMYKRLYDIKWVSNEMHKYQAYSVLVLRYYDKVYPNRFLELF